MERTSLKEVDVKNLESYIADYPIFCYQKKREPKCEPKLVMVHLADPDAGKRIYDIPDG